MWRRCWAFRVLWDPSLCPPVPPGATSQFWEGRGKGLEAPSIPHLDPESKGQWSQMDPVLQCQAGSSPGLRAPLAPGSMGPGWAWRLKWTSNSRTMGTQPSPLLGKG